MRQAIITLISIILLALIGLPTPPATHAQVPGPAARLQVARQNVQVMKLGTRQWLRPNNATTMNTGDRLRTDPNGNAIVTWFPDGIVTELAPNTEIVVEEFNGDEDNFIIRVSVVSGTVYTVIPSDLPEGAIYEVYTPELSLTSPTEARWAVNVDAEYATWLAITFGEVAVISDLDLETAVTLEADNLYVYDASGAISEDDPLVLADIEEDDENFGPFAVAVLAFEERIAPAEEDASPNGE